MFDLAGYLDRIGLDAAPPCNADGLARLQRAHRRAIPFENLDIPLGRGISLAPDALFAKLVTRRRGGYCFEQNSLYRDALNAIGFTVRPLLARVWLGANGVPPRTHMLNLVTIDDESWIADVGFGGSYTPPLRLVGGAAEADTEDGARHRLYFDADNGWMLERRGGHALAGMGSADSGEWQTQYSFSTEEVVAADLEMGNHWTATRPGTRFTSHCIVTLAPPGGFLSLTDRTLILAGSGTERIDIESAAQWQTLLENAFGIVLSASEVESLGLF